MKFPSLRFILDPLRRKLEGRGNLQKVIANVGWLFGDRLFKMALGLFVGVWIARYLGPEKFGLFSYALAFVWLFAFAATAGLHGIVVRQIVKEPDCSDDILGTAFAMQLSGGLLAFVMVLAAVSMLRPDEAFTRLITAILGFTLVFRCADVVKYWFEAQVQSRYTVWAENGVYLLMAPVKVMMILREAPLVAFVWAFFVEAFLIAASLILLYSRRVGTLALWRARFDRAKSFLKDGWPLIIAGFMITAYLRVDQVMIGGLLDTSAVGQYAVAVKLSELWHFVPTAITASVFPALINSKKQSEELYIARIQKLYDMMVLMALGVALPMTFMSGRLVNLLYGLEYSEAGTVLMIHIWGGIFVALGVAVGGWIMVENLQRLTAKNAAAGMVTNVIANYILIPRMGINGAAIATVISLGFASYLSFVFYKQGRKTFYLMSRALNPVRMAANFKRLIRKRPSFNI